MGDTIIPTVVDTDCSQSMMQADLIVSQLGAPETTVSIVCIHGASYTYKRGQLRFTVLGRTEEITVGLAKTLP